MIVVKLREAMEGYRRRRGVRITYAKLSDATGISQETLRSIGSRMNYHPTLANIEKICRALDVTPGDLLEIIDYPPKPKRRANKKKHKSR